MSFQLEFYEDEGGESPVLRWLREALTPTQRRAIGVAELGATPSQPCNCTVAEVALAGTLANPEVAPRLQRLAEKLERITASGTPHPPARALKPRCGRIAALITQVLQESEVPMHIADVHEAVEARLGEPVLLSSVKGNLARHAGTKGRFLRVARGRYQLRA